MVHMRIAMRKLRKGGVQLSGQDIYKSNNTTVHLLPITTVFIEIIVQHVCIAVANG